jgi:hypothetical protein
MKTLLALAAVLITTCVDTQAQVVRGHFRSNGTYVMPYYRTPANGIPYDNLSYRGYPSQQPGHISPRSYSLDNSFTLPSYSYSRPSYRSNGDCFGGGLQTMPNPNRVNRTRTYGF